MRRFVFALAAAAMLPAQALAQAKPVPEIHFLSWPAAKYQQYSEAARYIVEEWRKLGLKVNLDEQAFPNPMITMWFKDHKFDAVLSSLSGAPHRMEPDFFTNAQFNSKNAAPGNWNVGEFSNAKVDELGVRQLGIYDAEERKKVVLELQKAIVEEQPEAVIVSSVRTFAMNKDNMSIEGYQASPQGVRDNQNILRMKPKHGGAVRIGWTVSISTLNPLVATTIEDTDMAALLYDRLIWIGADGKPQMWLATALNVIDDKTVEVKLRTGHKFSDGKPVTAEDVKFSFEYLKESNAAYFTKYLDRLASVEIVNPETVRFKLSEPYAPFIMNTLGQVYVLPKHIWSTITKDLGIAKPQDFGNKQPVGSGPYTLKYWKEGQELYLSKRADHFAKPQSDVMQIIYGSAEIVGQSLRKGDIDISFQQLAAAAIDEFKAAKNIELFTVHTNGYESVRYKTTGPVFWNRDLRRALFYAIPYDAIVNEVYGGNGGKSSSPIVPANAFWHNASLEKPRFDPDRARAMLKEAGFTWDASGRLHFPPQ